MIKTLVVLVAAVWVANASRDSLPLEPKPKEYENEEGCYIPELDQVIPLNTTAPSKSSCAGYTCKGDYYEYIDCEIDLTTIEQDCTIGYNSDKSDPYPGCCVYISCVA